MRVRGLLAEADFNDKPAPPNKDWSPRTIGAKWRRERLNAGSPYLLQQKYRMIFLLE